MSPTAETSLRLTPHTVTHTLEDTVALLDVNSGMYYTIDEVGILLIETLGTKATLADAATRVTEQYEVTHEEALGDLIDLAEELLAEGLVEPDEA